MTHSKIYYSLRHNCKTVRKAYRMPAKPKDRIALLHLVTSLNVKRVREYCRFYRCGLSEFGLKNDRFAAILGAR